jgi:hypothetical protein
MPLAVIQLPATSYMTSSLIELHLLAQPAADHSVEQRYASPVSALSAVISS